jgi:hypothetical protein
MTASRNLSRARSHIIFIVALLGASAYILGVESSRGRASQAPGAAGGWHVELGAHATAEAAGRHWDQLQARAPGLRQIEMRIVPRPDGVRLQSAALGSQPDAKAICSAVQAAGERCGVISPSP